MDDSVSKLLALAVSLMLCLGAFTTAHHLQQTTGDYLVQLKDAGQRTGLVRQRALETSKDLAGFELIASIAHQLRQTDVQLDNADLVFEGPPRGRIGYWVDGNEIDDWSKLPLIDSSRDYRISYTQSDLGVVEKVVCVRIN